MVKTIHCKDVGFDCDGVVTADREEKVIQMAAEHAKTAHGVTGLAKEMVEKVKAVILDDP